MSKEMNFEETMQELEKIVQELEKGDLNLDDSINKFEEGMKLSKSASDYLEKAEKKITVLINDSDNNIEEQDLGGKRWKISISQDKQNYKT